MKSEFKLSKRLQAIASYLPKGTCFADIGSDHAYLPSYVCLQDPTATAIAGEVNIGPYESALETVRGLLLEQRIQVRLGDGLAVLDAGEVTEITIAGMGGPLITTILDAGKDKLDGVQQIIAQPNIGARNVRYWLMKNDYSIYNETIIEENGHFYEIIIAKKSPSIVTMDEKQLLFGPILLKDKSSVFLEKWHDELKNKQRIIKQMKQSTIIDTVKIAQFEIEINWIKEITENE